MEKILIVDTETANEIDCPIMYDFSFIVADLNGNVFEEYAFVVADVFLNKEMMDTAYFKDKIPSYWEEIKNGTRSLWTLSHIKKFVNAKMRENNITKIFAYNCRFDYLSTALTQRYITKSKYRWFFPYGTEFYDILKLTRNCLKNDEEYTKFCVDNAFLTKFEKPQLTAEVVYRFMNGLDFTEEHKGLEDCKIEYEILMYFLNKSELKEMQLFKKDKEISDEIIEKLSKLK